MFIWIMKNRRNSLFVDVSTLIVTGILLISVCIVWSNFKAWFTKNDTANSQDTIITSKDETIKELAIKAYYLTKENDTDNYYVKAEEMETKPFNMKNHNDIDVNYTAVLLEVSYEVKTLGSYSLSLYTPNQGIITSNTDLSMFANNYLSNAINVASVENNSGKYEVSDSDFKSFVSLTSDSSGKITATKSLNINILDKVELEGSGTINLIIDYRENNITYLYNEMLNIFPSADLSTNIVFNTDISLVMRHN